MRVWSLFLFSRIVCIERKGSDYGTWRAFSPGGWPSDGRFRRGGLQRLSIQKLKLRHALLVGLWFGVFQALMPAVGYLLGSAFAGLVQAVDHWVAFILLGIIGGNMIREGVKGDAEDCDPSLAFGTMLMLAVATSIDALAVGITFAFLNVPILAAVAFIGVVTFVISALGVKIGNLFGARYKSKAEIFGGAVLILIGAKILLEHLELLPF